MAGAAALLLPGCGSSSKPTSHSTTRTTSIAGTSTSTTVKGETTTTAAALSGPAPVCNAHEKLANGKLTITIDTNEKSVAYADDKLADPTTETVTISAYPWTGKVTLNDSKLDPVTVSIYGNRQQTSCTAIPNS